MVRLVTATPLIFTLPFLEMVTKETPILVKLEIGPTDYLRFRRIISFFLPIKLLLPVKIRKADISCSPVVTELLLNCAKVTLRSPLCTGFAKK